MEHERDNSLLQIENIVAPQSYLSLSNIDSPRKSNYLTSTPNNMKSFLKEATLSISNIKEKDVNMSSNSKEIISVTTENNYDGQVTDIDDGNEQGVIQITIEEPVIVLPNQFGKNYHTTTIQLISELSGECKLLTQAKKCIWMS